YSLAVSQLRRARMSAGGISKQELIRCGLANLQKVLESGRVAPESVDAMLHLMADLPEAEGQARCLLAQLEQQRPNSPEALHYRSLMEFAAGNYERARSMAKRLLEKTPDDRFASNIRKLAAIRLKATAADVLEL